MATDLPQTQLEAFYQFLGRRLQDGGEEVTPEDSVREFRFYQEELEKLNRETQPALEERLRGEGRPLDVEGLMGRVAQRLANEKAADQWRLPFGCRRLNVT